MKRITYWPQIVLGIAFNWGAMLGYSAVKGYCDWNIVLPLYIAGISWTLIYDTIYALQDKEDDLLVGVKSTALKFGENIKLWLSLFGVITISGFLVSGFLAEQNWPFYMGVALGAFHLVWQIKTLNIKDKSDCLSKFISNKWFGTIIFMGILLNKFVS
jgi:4-hydroxybenzoate polyprenyltransferase